LYCTIKNLSLVHLGDLSGAKALDATLTRAVTAAYAQRFRFRALVKQSGRPAITLFEKIVKQLRSRLTRR